MENKREKTQGKRRMVSRKQPDGDYNPYSEFGKRLSDLQGDKTQEQFAKELGISRVTLAKYTSGERMPDSAVLVYIASACHVSVDWLVGNSEMKSDQERLKRTSEYLGLSEDVVSIFHDRLAEYYKEKDSEKGKTLLKIFEKMISSGLIFDIANLLYTESSGN